MSVINNSIIAGASGQAGGAAAGYEIERSLRFDSSSSGYLSRTPSSAGNRKTWTWSGWVKRGKISNANQRFFGVFQGGVAQEYFRFESNDSLKIAIIAEANQVTTTQVFRDPSAWYHIVVVQDTTQATASDRLKVYVNGVQVTQFSSTSYPSQNADGQINNTIQHFISNGGGGEYFDGYLADVHHIDGQALDPTDFGEFDDNGVWQPIEYAGTFPGNSFHLDFADNSSAAALGYDAAGSNDWTVNNISAVQASYSSDLVALYGLTDPENAFDGSTSTRARDQDGTVNVTRNPPYTLEFIPSTPIPFSSQVRVFTGLNPGSPYNGKIYVDTGSGYGSAITPVQSTWQTIASGSGSLYKIKCTGDQNEANLNAVEIDGVVLVDSETDSLRDSPTNGDTADDTGAGGEVPGNYCTLNPLDSHGVAALSNGNLDFLGANPGYGVARGTIGATSGKFYWETTVNGTNGTAVGVCEINAPLTITSSTDVRIDAAHKNFIYTATTASNIGKITIDNVTAYNLPSTVADGDVFGVAVDIDAGKVWFSHNGVFQGSTTQNPATNTGGYTPTYLTSAVPYVMDLANTYIPEAQCNFGQRPFAYTAPSGFKALCTANLDDPTIADGSTAMDVVTYTGNGTTQSISGLEFSPDFVWIKIRSDIRNHALYDTVRNAGKVLFSNNAEPEYTTNDLTSFDTNGFSVSTVSGTRDETNMLNATYAGWCWDAGGNSNTFNVDGTGYATTSAAGITEGTISLTGASVNRSAGFSIVTYDGSGSSATVGHGLGVTPKMVIAKRRNATGWDWPVWHTSLTSGTYTLFMDLTDAQANRTDIWDGAPTSTVFKVNTSGQTNDSSGTYVAYCFAPVEGYSAFGSYVGGDSNPKFVYTGFRPKFILVKETSSNSYPNNTGWYIWDSVRGTYNYNQLNLTADSSNQEGLQSGGGAIGTIGVDMLSNGFCLRGNGDVATNWSGGTYIYAAFAESPFKYARAR